MLVQGCHHRMEAEVQDSDWDSAPEQAVEVQLVKDTHKKEVSSLVAEEPDWDLELEAEARVQGCHHKMEASSLVVESLVAAGLVSKNHCHKNFSVFELASLELVQGPVWTRNHKPQQKQRQKLTKQQ